jgi:hypothetical protein
VKPRSLLWMTLGTFAIALGVLVGGFVRTGRAQAQDETVTCRADFSLLRLAAKESVRVHTSYVNGDGEPLNVRVEFLDRLGRVVDTTTQSLAPKETVSAVFDGSADLTRVVEKDATGGTAAESKAAINVKPASEFRTAVFVEPASGEGGFPAEIGCPQVVTAMERVSAAGATSLVLSPELPIGVLQLVLRPCKNCPSPTTPPPSDAGFPTDTRPVDTVFSTDVSPADSFHPADTFLPPPADTFLPPADTFLPPADSPFQGSRTLGQRRGR